MFNDSALEMCEEITASFAAVSTITQFIAILRDIDKNTDPIQYRSAVELILDYLKYGIADADRKLLIRRF